MAKKPNATRVESNSSNSVRSNKKRGREKVKGKFTTTSKQTNLNTGEVSNMETTYKTKTKFNRKGVVKTKEKVKQKFTVKNKDGKLLMKDTKKATSKNGKTKINRNKARVTKNYKKL